MDIKQLFECVITGNINLTDVESWVESEKINYQKPDINNNLAKFSENGLDHLIDKYSDWEIRMNEFARTVSHYAESANELIDSEPDRAILIAKVRKIVSKLVPNPRNLANADFQLGYLLWQTKHYHDAIQPLREAASLYSESANEPLGEVTALSYLSSSLRQDKRPILALKAADELLEKATKYKFHGHIASALLDKGQVLADLGSAQEAIYYLQQAVDRRKSISDEEADEQGVTSIGAFLGSLGISARRLEYFEIAVSKFRELAELQENAGNKFLQARAISDIGYTYAKKGDSSRAIQYLEKAISLTPKISRDSLDDVNRWQSLVQCLRKELLRKNSEKISLIEADTLEKAECTYCGRELKVSNPIPMGYIQCICGYRNLFEQEVEQIPLMQWLQRYTSSDNIHNLLRDTDNPDEIIAILNRLLEILLNLVREQVTENPKIAAAAVWKCLVEFDRRSREIRSRRQAISVLESSVLRATQILIACLFERGELPRSPSDLTDNEIVHFISIFSPVASNAAGIAALLDNLYRKVMHASLRDGILYCQKTYLHTQLKEWELNRNIYSKQSANQLSDDELVSAASIEAQSIYLGFSPYTVAAQLFDNKHLKLNQLAVYKEASVYYIPATVCSAEIRNFFSCLTLTPERIINFKSPFYLDLGEEEKESSERCDFSLKLAQKNWMNYYPVVSAVNPAGETVFLVSAEVLTYTCANLETFKNRLLQRIYDVTKERSLVHEKAIKQLANLRNEANRTFENFATEIARTSGWYAETSLQRIGNEILPGGEIDVLMANCVDGELKIVLAEVKDFDITLLRIYSESRLGQRISHAETQVDKKSEAVRLFLIQLLTKVCKGEIDIAQINHISLIKIIITSNYLPAHLFTRYPGVALGELSKFLEGLDKGSFPSRFISSQAWEDLNESGVWTGYVQNGS